MPVSQSKRAWLTSNLGIFVNLGVLFLTTCMWINSCLLHIYKLVPSLPWYEIRQYLLTYPHQAHEDSWGNDDVQFEDIVFKMYHQILLFIKEIYSSTNSNKYEGLKMKLGLNFALEYIYSCLQSSSCVYSGNRSGFWYFLVCCQSGCVSGSRYFCLGSSKYYNQIHVFTHVV